jgi:hypothetical protein
MVVGLDHDGCPGGAKPCGPGVDVVAPDHQFQGVARGGVEPGHRRRAWGGEREQGVAEAEHDVFWPSGSGNAVGLGEAELVAVEGKCRVDVAVEEVGHAGGHHGGFSWL